MRFNRRKPSAPETGPALREQARSAARGREASLSMVPVRNALVREETRDAGFARLTYLSAYRPWFARIAKRIGDEAAGVAARALGILDRQPLPRSLLMEELFGFALDAMHKAARAFADLDADLARELCVDSEDALELNI